MKLKKQKTYHLNVKFPPDIADALHQHSETTGANKTWIINQAVSYFLKKYMEKQDEYQKIGPQTYRPF